MFSPKHILSDLLTGKDGQSHDMGRWSWMLSSLAVCGGSVMNWFHGTAIDIMSLGAALSGLAATHGYAIKAKKETEPDAE